MTHEHEHHGHSQHGHKHKPASKGLHKDWRTWLIVGLMLAAMAVYVLSDNEALQPGGREGQQMPAAAGP